MKRREFVKALGTGTLLATGLGACGQEKSPAAAKTSSETFEWKMVTTWPPNFPGLGTGANNLARIIGEMSGGRLTVKVYGAGELVPALETFDAVSRGTAQMGHGASYYWKGKTPAAQFFAAVPFGMTADEMNAWLYAGGGLKLWRDLYDPFGLIPFPCGNTGVQMGGWFNRKIDSLADLKGLKMRIPGLGGEVLKRAGGTPVSLPGGEIFTSLETGAIDATEWVGPYNDMAFGLHKAAKYYYYPGWHEPGSVLECIVNKAAYAKLPADLQAIVREACKAITSQMLSEYEARNAESLKTLREQNKVKILPFPVDVMIELKRLTSELLEEMAASDEHVRTVYTAYRDFQTQVSAWDDISEKAYLDLRDSSA